LLRTLIGGQPRIVPPPIEANLFGLVDGADEETNLNGEELDVREVDLDVTRDDETLVEHSIEDVDQPVTA
jgi:hypothetical protein